MTKKEIIKALIDLSPLSMTKIAKQASVDPANLSAWFTQDRYLSDEAIDRIENVIGIEGDTLSADKVFVWIVGRDFSLLKMLIDTYFKNPKLMPIVKKRVRRYELSELFGQPMATLTDEKGLRALLILKTSVLRDLAKDVKSLPWFSPEFLPMTSWADSVQDNSRYPFPTPLQAPASAIHEWKKGNIKTQDFNELFIDASMISWQQVIESATELGLGPAIVMDWLKTKKASRN